MSKQLISVIVPVHNEASNLAWHHKKIVKVLEKIPFRAEVIYVNDGSSDSSLDILKTLKAKEIDVRYISFSRNFGKEAATSAGLQNCKGDAAIMIDADGQHPIDMLPQFIKEWLAGNHVVIGVRTQNTNEGLVKKYGSLAFNKVLNSFTGGNTKPGSTDFRLLDRRVINQFNTLTEHNRITRGLIDWLGFKRSFVEFIAPARHSGEASYGVGKLIKLAFHALVSQTTKPLQVTGLLGVLVMALSAIVGIAIIFEKYALGDPLELAITGTALLALFISFLVGLVMISNWLLALYIESIHSETQNRPLYIVEESSDE